MARCLHSWLKEYLGGYWLGLYRCKRCRKRGVCPSCFGSAPVGYTVRYCEQHQ
jgi:hypothetical protein